MAHSIMLWLAYSEQLVRRNPTSTLPPEQSGTFGGKPEGASATEPPNTHIYLGPPRYPPGILVTVWVVSFLCYAERNVDGPYSVVSTADDEPKLVSRDGVITQVEGDRA